MANVLGVLMVRVSISISVVLSFCIHDSKEDSIHIPVYVSTVGFSLILLWQLEERRRASYADTFSMVLLTLAWSHTSLTIWILKFNNGVYSKAFIEDSVKPFAQYSKIYRCAIQDILNLMALLSVINQYFGMSCTQFLLFIAFLTPHAAIILILLELVITISYSLVIVTFSENFFYTFDVNNSVGYPRGYIAPEMLDRASLKMPVMQNKYYSFDRNGKYVFTHKIELDERVDSFGSKFPYTYQSIQRYAGEDMTLTCIFRVLNPSVVQTTLWRRNGTIIKNDNRIISNMLITKDDNSSNVEFTLRIQQMQDSDFGLYECVYVISMKKESIHIVSKETKLGIYNVTEVAQKIDILYKQVGNLVASRNFFWYHTDADISDIHVTYTINNIPVESVCPGYSTKSCSIGANILRRLIRVRNSGVEWDGETVFPFIDIADVTILDLKKTNIYYCICSEAFGIHKVVFERKVFSKSSDTSFVLMDIQHPFVFVVLPRAQISLFRRFDHSHLYEGISNLVAQNASIDVIELKLNQIMNLIHAYEEDAFNIINIAESLFSIGVLMFFFIFLNYILHIYFYLFVQIPIRRFLPLRGVHRFHIKDKILDLENYLHDVFVSFSDKEYDFVSGVLIPYLEDSCNANVCHPDRDLNPGQTPFSLYTEHITKSRYIITVLSQGYKTDPLCQNLQLEHIILRLLYEQKRSQRDMLFILYDDGATLLDILRWNDEVEKMDWRKNCSQQHKLEMVKRWLAATKTE